ncbi:DUF4287 domain-containing protein [Glaciihabitans sp. dw_435]|uniref:DUF4287 domain-containing protein n=1 Tax=Glaciihabitans sp. dw_435 TaxID=2720081 RepID=UPI001BD5BCB9|nr:DUF4287 domain-containing protein [Glaciihabitans sp. dw_435]
MSVAGNSSGIGDDAMTAATGRTPAEWFAILDAANATTWKHTAIARWLFDTYGDTATTPATPATATAPTTPAAPAPTATPTSTPISGWWCQAVTVRYEQARGMRAPGQQPDGTFEVSSSRSIPTDQQHALDVAIALVTADLGNPPASVGRDSSYPRARWKLDNGETIVTTAHPPKNGKTSVTLTHSRIPDSTRLPDARAALAQLLAKLPSALD